MRTRYRGDMPAGCYEPADRVWFAARARLVPRGRWAGVLPVTPATLLAWRRRLAAGKYDTSERRKPVVCKDQRAVTDMPRVLLSPDRSG